jgi:hypothetical protein
VSPSPESFEKAVIRKNLLDTHRENNKFLMPKQAATPRLLTLESYNMV